MGDTIHYFEIICPLVRLSIYLSVCLSAEQCQRKRSIDLPVQFVGRVGVIIQENVDGPGGQIGQDIAGADLQQFGLHLGGGQFTLGQEQSHDTYTAARTEEKEKERREKGEGRTMDETTTVDAERENQPAT